MFRNVFCAIEPGGGRCCGRLISLGLCALFLFLIAPATGAAGEFSGTILYRHGIGLTGADAADAVLDDTYVELGWKTAGDLGWNMAAQGRWRRETRLGPDPYQKASIRELRVSRDSSNCSFSLGKQEVVWGRMDIFPLLDVVNPHDIREFVLGDEARDRIPLWLGTATAFWSDQSLQVVVVPDIAHNRLPQSGGLFDPTRSLLPAGVAAEFLPVGMPSDSPDNWEAGLRWTGQIGNLELSVLAYDGWSHQPVYFTEFADTTGLLVQPRLERQRLFGISGDFPVGATIWRFAALFTPDGYRTYTSRGLAFQKKQNVVHLAVGMDWTPDNWLIGWQLFYFDDSGIPADLATPAGPYATAVFERYWLQHRLRFQGLSMFGLNKDDYWIHLEMSYEWRGRYQISLAIDDLGGNPQCFFGRFDDQDRIITAWSIKF